MESFKKSASILFISPLPPPAGGIATWTAIIQKIGLPDNVSFSILNTSLCGKRNIFDKRYHLFEEVVRNVKILTNLLKHLLFNRPIIIHLNSALSPTGIFRDFVCVLLATVLRIPIVTHFHGHLPDFKGSAYFGLSQQILKYLMALTTINIVENQGSYQYILNYFKRKNVCMLPNFVEERIFNFARQNTNNKKMTAFFAGGITEAKGARMLLRLAYQFPEINFQLYGKLHEDMVYVYSQTPANLILHEAVDHDCLLKKMCDADFLIFPSHSEGFPMTVLEAMSIGLPVICSRVGALPEMIEEGKGGFLCHPMQENEFISAIERLIGNTDQLTAMGQYNRHKSQAQYQYSIVANDLLKIYQRISDKLCVV